MELGLSQRPHDRGAGEFWTDEKSDGAVGSTAHCPFNAPPSTYAPSMYTARGGGSYTARTGLDDPHWESASVADSTMSFGTTHSIGFFANGGGGGEKRWSSGGSSLGRRKTRRGGGKQVGGPSASSGGLSQISERDPCAASPRDGGPAVALLTESNLADHLRAMSAARPGRRERVGAVVVRPTRPTTAPGPAERRVGGASSKAKARYLGRPSNKLPNVVKGARGRGQRDGLGSTYK